MSFSLGTMVALCSSCAMLDDRLEPQTTDEVLKQVQTKERLELESAVRRRLSHISGLLAEGKLDTAEELLLPLTRHEFCRNEVKLLHDQLMLARRRLEVDFQGSETSARMHREVDDKLTLPGNYGKTIVIDSSLDPLELPQGKMEDLINRKVSMALENASVGTIVDFLNENGLNVIADDALLGDKPETKTLTLKVNDVPLKEIFSYIARNMGIAFYIGENLVWITAGEETSGPKLETRILRLRQGFVPTVPQGGGAPGATGGGGGAPQVEDTELADVLEAFLEGSPEGSSYQIFKTRNILVIRNTRENIRFVEQILHEFDKQPLQVVIEARFITVSSGDLKDVGVQITQTEMTGTRDHDRGEGGIRGHEANFLTSLGQLDEANGMGALTLSGVIGRRLFDVVIQAIENKESSVTLSVPRVTVMNNRSARIRKGTKIYYFDEYELSSVDRGDNGTEERLVPSGDPTELPLGLTFDVNVNIGNDGRTVLLGLHPEIVEFIAWEDYLTTGGDDDDSSSSSDSGTELTQVKLPRTHEQSVTTTVGVQSGETVVLGGMIEQSKKHTVKKIPLLGDLPFIGWLFRRTTTENEPVNLLIFVTATVINDRGEYVRTRAEGEALPSAK